MITIRHVASVLAITFCISCVAGRDSVSTNLRGDPVVFIYHVKPGAELKLEGILKRAWEIYKTEKLVLAEPHACLRVKEDADKERFVEAFCWAGPFATEYPSKAVNQIWTEIQSLCENREGNPGMEMRRAKLIMP